MHVIRAVVRIGLVALLATGGITSSLRADRPTRSERGHDLSIIICGHCHVAASDQAAEPNLRPPATAFSSLVERQGFSPDGLKTFLTTPHEELPLLEYQISEITAYLTRLRRIQDRGGGAGGARLTPDTPTSDPLKDCLAAWDALTTMSKREWEATCRRTVIEQPTSRKPLGQSRRSRR
jgi:hypothetical protein